MRRFISVVLTCAVVLCMSAGAFVGTGVYGGYASYAATDSDNGNNAAAVAAEGAAAVENAFENVSLTAWKIAETEAAELPDEAGAAFTKAVSGFDGEIVPVALFGAQLVDGMNYMILCRVKAKPEVIEAVNKAGEEKAKSEAAQAAAPAEPAAEAQAETPAPAEPAAETPAQAQTAAPAEPETALMAALIHEDMQGNASITRLTAFSLEAYTGGEEAAEDGDEDSGAVEEHAIVNEPAGDETTVNTESAEAESSGEEAAAPANDPLANTWAIPVNYTRCELSDDVKAVYDKALKDFVGNELDPMALIGTEDRDGMSYAILCHSILTTADSVESIQVVTVYEDEEGQAYIVNISTVDPNELSGK